MCVCVCVCLSLNYRWHGMLHGMDIVQHNPQPPVLDKAKYASITVKYRGGINKVGYSIKDRTIVRSRSIGTQTQTGLLRHYQYCWITRYVQLV